MHAVLAPAVLENRSPFGALWRKTCFVTTCRCSAFGCCDSRMAEASIPVLEDTTLPARARAETRPDAWLNPKRFSLMLGLFILVLFPGVIFGTQTFFFRDYGIFGYPLASYHRECFWRG